LHEWNELRHNCGAFMPVGAPKISIDDKGRVAGGDRPATLLWRRRLKMRLGAEVKG
jgi:hypothetical protein